MIRHYLITAARTFARHKLYSFINIFGLAIGLASAIIIAVYVRDQLSYDKWIPNTGNLYRLEVTAHIPGRAEMATTRAPYPILTLAGQHVPQVTAIAHVVPQMMTVRIADRAFRENVTVVEPNFLRMIPLPLAKGDAQRVLVEPDSVVLSQSTARKYFGDVDPVGKTLTITPDESGSCDPNADNCENSGYSLKVSGVLRDLPHNTQLVADIVIPNTSRADGLSREVKETGWSDISAYGYVQLAPNAKPAAALQALNPVLDRTFDLRKAGIDAPFSKVVECRLTPFTDVHLTSDKYGGMRPGGSWTAIVGLMILAGLVVLVACFNFMNLATARAMLRHKEVAARKLGGARRGELVMQFLGEAVLLALAALAVALVIVEMIMPAFTRFVGEPISFHYLQDWSLLLGIAGATVLVGFVSGSYPAFVLSALRPAVVLKPNAAMQSGSSWVRSTLVVAQFAVSIAIGIAALVILRQLGLARTLDLGFEREGVLVIYGTEAMAPTTREAFAQALQKNPNVVAAAYSSEVPFDLHHTGDLVIRLPGEQQSYRVFEISSSAQFPELYGMRLIAGRLLSADRGEDASTYGNFRNIVVTEATARRLGLTAEKAAGKEIQVLGGQESTARIVGVLSDTKLHGINEIAQPFVYAYDANSPGAATRLSVRLRNDDIPETLAFIDKTWKSFEPGKVIARRFVSDTFEETLQAIQRQGVLVGALVAIAICIACLGLFGLAVFTAERRTKEIGVRKIAGARTRDIVLLLLWRISIPVLIANLVAWPVAYYFLKRWLAGYAYQVSLSPLYFVGVGVAALLIAWSTVFAHTLRLGRASAVHALRYE